MGQLLGQVTIVGTGLLGASLGLALRKQGIARRVVGVGRRPETVERARELGAVDEVAGDVAAASVGSDLVVIATPLGAYEPVLQALAACERPTVITDVGSTKRTVCQLAASRLRYPNRFVGSHPMAGSERQGPDAASADLFTGKPCIITPDGADADAVECVRRLWRTLGMNVLAMDAADHDRQVALISHLPHLVAMLLVDLAAQGEALPLASTGFADTTRIASGDPAMWADVFATNRDAALEAIDQLTGKLALARQMLADDRYAEVLQWLERSKTARDTWRRGDATE